MLYFSLSGLFALDFCLTDCCGRGAEVHHTQAALCSRSHGQIVIVKMKNKPFKKLQVRKNSDISTTASFTPVLS